ncbi:hypothetical protein FMEAI12_4020103 [Parafrankia sp. Ea1.12]|nr:hypothetical protein FMEAI12_4020103 [Parafrankia sp. Ea1.12]
MADPSERVADTPEQWAAKEATVAAMPTPPEVDDEPAAEAPFVVTKEYRRFAEFADAVRRDRYIGLCYGPPGVGKTLSARRYAHWDLIEPAVQAFKFFEPDRVPRKILDTRSALYTPKVHNSPGRLDKDLAFIQDRLSWMIQTLEHPDHAPQIPSGRYAELLLVDEADRLKTATLEQLRDRRRADPDRHARHREAPGPLPAALQQRRVRPPLPGALRRGAGVRAGPPLARARPARPGRLHHRRDPRHDHPHHQRQLPAHRPPDRPDQAGPGHQPALHSHQGSRRGRPRVPRHRRAVSHRPRPHRHRPDLHPPHPR